MKKQKQLREITSCTKDKNLIGATFKVLHESPDGIWTCKIISCPKDKSYVGTEFTGKHLKTVDDDEEFEDEEDLECEDGCICETDEH